MDIEIRAWSCVENGVRFMFVDANNTILDNVATLRVRGDDGHVYTSGIFGFKASNSDDTPKKHIYIIGVQRTAH